MSSPESAPSLDDARTLLNAGKSLLDPILERAREVTAGGNAIDDHQVLTERTAYAATEARAAEEVLNLASQAQSEGRLAAALEQTAIAAVGDLIASLRNRLDPVLPDLGLDEAVLETAFPAETRSTLRAATRPRSSASSASPSTSARSRPTRSSRPVSGASTAASRSARASSRPTPTDADEEQGHGQHRNPGGVRRGPCRRSRGGPST